MNTLISKVGHPVECYARVSGPFVADAFYRQSVQAWNMAVVPNISQSENTNEVTVKDLIMRLSQYPMDTKIKCMSGSFETTMMVIEPSYDNGEVTSIRITGISK